MLHPHAEIYLHFVWATYNREALITMAAEAQLFAVIAKKCEAFNCVVLAIGGMPDHVHLLVRMPAPVAPADLIQEIKGSSSHAMNHQIAPARHFRWQGSYGVFSVSVNGLTAVSTYIRMQKQHHADSSLDVRLEKINSE